MVTPDYDKSNHILASIFVRQIYYVLAKKASLNDTSKCDREVIFNLDEFGNMPSIEGFANIITVCLGRGIRFNMIIQAYSQLKNLYGEDAPTIEGNCGNQIYIMTNEGETAKKFSELLGDKTIITNSRSGEVFSLNKSQTESLDARKLLKSDELMKLKEGETVVVRVIKRQDNNRNKIVSYPIYNNDEHSMKYRYEYLDDYFDNQEMYLKI
ncbi:type IV secretory system Conjugative DNA transfer family protein [[Clostridium] sordellii ATCC 9714]|nr:type IV secretory system Conjugative DNA transfer family protein [[Clostridium] sordellii ATCC 9714] [Paeniclostridium sordellii ATCC 9714]